MKHRLSITLLYTIPLLFLILAISATLGFTTTNKRTGAGLNSTECTKPHLSTQDLCTITAPQLIYWDDDGDEVNADADGKIDDDGDDTDNDGFKDSDGTTPATPRVPFTPRVLRSSVGTRLTIEVKDGFDKEVLLDTLNNATNNSIPTAVNGIITVSDLTIINFDGKEVIYNDLQYHSRVFDIDYNTSAGRQSLFPRRTAMRNGDCTNTNLFTTQTLIDICEGNKAVPGSVYLKEAAQFVVKVIDITDNNRVLEATTYYVHDNTSPFWNTEQNELICTDSQQSTPTQQCGTGEIRINGSCVTAECTQNSDCTGANQKCINRVCVTARCTSNSECSGSQVCTNRSCVTPPTCTTNSDCSQGQVCTNGACVAPSPPPPPPPPPPVCTQNSDCTGGKVCTNGACVTQNPPPPPPRLLGSPPPPPPPTTRRTDGYYEKKEQRRKEQKALNCKRGINTRVNCFQNWQDYLP